jgi:transposase, IS5 family
MRRPCSAGPTSSNPPPYRLLEHSVVLARSLKVTRGRKLRLDGTGVATNIQHPTDSTWLDDGVRVLSRLVGHAKQAMHEATVMARSAFRARTRSAKRQMKRIMEAARQRGAQVEDRRRTAYQRLLTITTTMVQQAARVGSVLIDQGPPRGRPLATALHWVVPVVQPVMTQTTRRISKAKPSLPQRKWSACLNPILPSSARASRAGLPNLAGCAGWMRSRGASSAATPC